LNISEIGFGQVLLNSFLILFLILIIFYVFIFVKRMMVKKEH
jgi:hypothetical protein